MTPTTTNGQPGYDQSTASAEWRWPALFYLVCVAAFYRFYRYDFGPDAVSYVTIAREYSLGRWAEAVNVSWSPVFSWLLAPMLVLGMPALTAARIISVLSGLLALYATALLTGPVPSSGDRCGGYDLYVRPHG